jgi:hypothetical protein
VAATTLGLLHGWPWALVLLKPTVAPLLLFANWRRALPGFVVLLAMCLATLPLWPQYITAAVHATTPGLLYSIPSAPLLLVPVIAWLARDADLALALNAQARARAGTAHEEVGSVEAERPVPVKGAVGGH